MTPRPADYPMTANSGIADAEAFRVGNSTTVHRPARFPDGNKVIAACGVYGWATERSRIASSANAYVDCAACGGDPNANTKANHAHQERFDETQSSWLSYLDALLHEQFEGLRDRLVGAEGHR